MQGNIVAKELGILSKSKFTAVALVLLLTLSVFMICLPISKAMTFVVTASLSARPNPVGVSQPILLNFWLQPETPGNPWVFHNFTLEITHPDGEVENTGTMPSLGSDGTQWLEYVPDVIGEWKFQFKYLGETYPAGLYFGRTTLVQDVVVPAATSPITVVTVQQDPISYYQWTPLPTDYWSRPINAQNRGWYVLGGSWLMGGYDTASTRANLYSEGPESAHVLYAKNLQLGGLLGGLTTGENGTDFSPYNAQLDPFRIPAPTICVAGLSYYTENGRTHCFDLRTGEEKWVLTGVTASLGTFDWLYGSELGTGGNEGTMYVAYLQSLSGGRLIKWRAETGDLVVNISLPTGISSGTFRDPFYYTTQNLGNTTNPVYRLVKWNSHGANTNFTTRIVAGGYNVSTILGGISGITSDGAIGYYFTWTYLGYFGQAAGTYTSPSGAFDTKTGNLLWNRNMTESERSYTSGGADNRYYVYPLLHAELWDNEVRGFEAVDLYTGNRAWLSEAANYPWGTFWAYSRAVAYGQFYELAYDGIYAYANDTGKLNWVFRAGNDSGFETPYNTWPFFSTPFVAENKIYVATAEHTPTPPLWRGGKLFCVDTTTGKGLWNISFYGGYFSSGTLADGLLGYMNMYDNLFYVFGKGETDITVSVPQTSVPNGISVLIQGTILDKSTTPNVANNVIGKPNTPCIADDDQGGWMEYLYMQQPMPASLHGVPVTLRAMRSDGTIIEIGTVTSDMKGTFKTEWTPPDNDLYTITATFDGSKSYFSSWTETGLSVTEQAAEVVPPQDLTGFATESSVMMYTIGAAVAIIIALAIVTILLLRKK